MTQTLDAPAPSSPTQDRVDAWLAEFESALTDRDVDRAAGMFAATSFWRDLIAFTWNLKTVENPDGVADLLRATLEATDPRALAGRPRTTRTTRRRGRAGPCRRMGGRPSGSWGLLGGAAGG